MDPTQDTPVASATPQEPQTPTQDEPIAPPAPVTSQEENQTVPSGQVETQETATVAAPPEVPTEEEDTAPYQPVAPVPPLDFSQLPVDENNLIDPNALAAQINQRISMAEQNALNQAQRIYAENENEKRLWDKTYEKYPDLKANKELQNMVQQARIGEATDILSKATSAQEAAAMKLPTPQQIADKLFKYIGTAKAEGIQQAQTNTIVQKSAQLETAGRTSNDGADATTQARANINNPNKQVADKARSQLLQQYLGWNK